MASAKPPQGDADERDLSARLLTPRSLLLFLVAGIVATLAAIGAGITAWNQSSPAGPMALIAALLTGGAVGCVTFIGVAAALHRLVS